MFLFLIESFFRGKESKTILSSKKGKKKRSNIYEQNNQSSLTIIFSLSDSPNISLIVCCFLSISESLGKDCVKSKSAI